MKCSCSSYLSCPNLRILQELLRKGEIVRLHVGAVEIHIGKVVEVIGDEVLHGTAFLEASTCRPPAGRNLDVFIGENVPQDADVQRLERKILEKV